jgi:adenylyltransferase/sulfurtransferase
MSKQASYDRYQRQLILKGFGVTAQDKLRNGRVLVIGAGGLGCPILQYLVAAGVGYIGVADHDRVSLSNLHRQILFDTDDIGQFKVDVAKKKLQALNPDVEIQIWNEQWQNHHCLTHFPQYDIVVDATDNFASRYMINDAAVLLGKPLVFGAVSQYEGQVAVFNSEKTDGMRSVNYRDLFPEPPKDGEVLNCSEAGVLGVLPGIIGSMQAMEVIKLLAGLGTPLADKLWNYNGLTQEVFILNLNPRSSRPIGQPQTQEEFMNTRYEELCGVVSERIKEIDFDEWKQNHLTHLLVDIRESYEQPRLNKLAESMQLNFKEIPLSELEAKMENLQNQSIVFVCQAGRRSLQAASMLMEKKSASSVCSLKGGVNGLVALKLI